MKRSLLLLTFFNINISLLTASPATAAETQARSPKAVILKSLSINRSMLSRFESEYAALSEKEKETSSEEVKRELVNVQYKIKALDEENKKLTEALPETMQASEFLKDMLAKSEAQEQAVQNPPSAGTKSEAATEETPSSPSPTVTETQNAGAEFKPTLRSDKNPASAAKEKTNPKTYQLHERALEFVAKKELKKAVQLYQEIVLIDPNDDEAYLIMGHCLVLTGDYEKAEDTFQSAVQINRENVRQIVPFYENLVLQNPGDPEAYANLGFVYLMFGNLNRANEAFGKALSINPEDANALRGMQIIANQPH